MRPNRFYEINISISKLHLKRLKQMKKLRTLIIIGLLVFSCKPEEKQTDTIISGSAPGVYNGIRVYLKVKDFKTKRETPIDTAIVMNEKFSFENKSKQPQLTFLTVDNVAGNLTIITEPTDMSVTINKFNIKESTVTGSTMQTDYENYEATLREIQNKYNRNFQNYRNASRRNETNLRDSLTYVLNSLKKQLAEFPVNYIKDNPNKALCLILIEQEIQQLTLK